MNWYEIALGVVLIVVSVLIVIFTLAQEQKGRGLSGAIMGESSAMAAGRQRGVDAKLAKLTIVETYDFIETLPTKKERDAHLKRVEAGLKRQYGPALKKLSRSQGRLLVKLVNRECNQTGYNIARAFLGSFKANLYQSVAVLFGNSLTKKYDPEGDDQFTERVVRMVEAGLL